MSALTYKKLNKRINEMIEYENDYYLSKMNLKEIVSEKLLPYQFLHVLNLVTALRYNNIILDGSDTGTGKTYTSIALCKQLNLVPAIICPKTVRTYWLEVCKYFKVAPLFVVNYDMIKNGKIDSNTDCEYIQVKKNAKNEDCYDWKLPRNTIIIFDEVHKCKNRKTQNAVFLMSTIKQKVLMLSATLSDTPKSFQVFGYMLGFYNNMRKANGWCKGMLREDANQISKVELSAINKSIYPQHGSRMQIAEIGNQFPSNQIISSCYDIDEKDRVEVNNAFKKISICNKLERKEGSELDILREITKARYKIELLKVPIFEEMINNHLDDGFSVAVFVNFKETLRKLAKKFKTTCLVYGDIPANQKVKNIEDFQENKSRIIICTSKSATGINLHDLYGSRRVSLISPSFSSIELKQVLGRIHRAGSVTPALQKIIYCSGTCEEYICNNVKNKLEFISKLNDNDLITIMDPAKDIV